MVKWHLACYSLCFVVHPVVDVSAQGGCNVTPINPTSLTAGGGILINGTENVMIQCNCTDDDMVVDPVAWYDPNGNGLFVRTHITHVPGTPYYNRVPDDTNIILVIPTFTDSYDGIYTCGRRVNNGAPNATVNLAIVNLAIGGK